MPSVRSVLHCACVCAMLAAAPARAQTAPGYRVDHWTTDDGLPSAFISSIVQTRDGFLWLASGGNLVRFDGFDFRVYNAATDSAITGRVNVLYAGLGDTLWLGLANNRIVAMVDGRFARIAVSPQPLYALSQDGQGALLTFGEVIQRMRGGTFETVATPPGWTRHVTNNPIVWRDATGAVWVPGTHGARLRITERGAAVVDTSLGSALVIHRTRNQVLSVRRRGLLAEVVDATGVVLAAYRWHPRITPHLIDRSGRLWVTKDYDLQVYEPGNADPVEVIAVPRTFSGGSILEDRAGNVWIAGVGLLRLQAVPFRTVTPGSGLAGFANQFDRLTRGPQGGVLARLASPPNHVYRIDGGRPSLFEPGRAFAAADLRGTVWVAHADGGRDRLRGRRAGQPDLVAPRAGTLLLADDPVHPGSIWMAGGQWLYRVEPYGAGGPRVADSLAFDGVPRAAAVGPDGAMWVAGTGADGQQQLRRLDGGRPRVYARLDGLPGAEVRTILPDSDGTVWLGTYGAGLARLRDGRFQTVRERDGLAENVVSNLLDDGVGNFWMGGNRSVHRVAIADARAFLDGRAARVHGVAFGRRDGISDPETSGYDGTRTDDGRLWFPTFGGAAVVDPVEALALDSTPPLVHVLGIALAGDTLLPPGSTRLPRGQRRLAIAYTALALRNPAGVRFEYRMDGVDRDWIYAGAIRVATYNDVGPGRHTFRVRAINAGGVSSRDDATLTFTVPRYFYETIPFYLLLATLLAVGVRWLVTLRTRQLQRRQEALRAQVDARTAELGQALVTVEAQASQLRTLDEAKSRFFANVSHEFRTPLSLILGPVEDVRDGRAGPLPELARQRLGSVMANGRRLVQLVEQLLDVARLESGTLHLKADVRDLVPLLRRIAESFASLAERRGLGFRVSCPVGGLRVRYDPDQMEKVVTNLLGNALKFTPRGGRVELRATTEGEDTDAWVVVEVEDTGPGIPAAHLPRVFDRFYQVDDSPRRAHEGAGIGLALARELVDLHGGTLSARSVEGSGSTFIVRLPLTEAEIRTTGETPVPDDRLAARAASAAGPALSGHAADDDGPEVRDVTTVLVAEDNAELLAYLRDHLADHYRVIEAGTGSRALALAREHVPDLIVSDVMMPEMDGQALCEAVKRDPEIDFIPVILLTAKASRESRLSGLEGGADDYLAKPVDMRELLVRAANLITSRRRLKERYQEAHRDLPTLAVPFTSGPRDADSADFLRNLYAAMAEHVGDEAFQVDGLASAVGMGRSTLYRRLDGLMGKSPMDVLWDYRLEQAAQWLGETDANVSEIAYGVGFKSVPHFCSRFRERFGHTPSTYRARQAPARSAHAQRSVPAPSPR